MKEKLSKDMEHGKLGIEQVDSRKREKVNFVMVAFIKSKHTQDV